MLPGASACSVCGERDHTSSRCPCLHSPLTPGFYTGGGGGGGHSHDDDDESSKTKINFGFFDMSIGLVTRPIDENESLKNKGQRFHNFINRSTKDCGHSTSVSPLVQLR
jgi:hypothetical protein